MKKPIRISVIFLNQSAFKSIDAERTNCPLIQLIQSIDYSTSENRFNSAFLMGVGHFEPKFQVEGHVSAANTFAGSY